jgi:hypothetical protein
VIASFLGGQAIARNGLNAWVVSALAAFALVVLLSVFVLLPRQLFFWIDTERVYRTLLPRGEDDRAIDQILARLHRDLRSLNEPQIARAERTIRLAGLVLIVETTLLGLGLA